MTYMRTKLFRFLVKIKKNTQNGARGVYQFVPLQDFSKSGTDEELYEKYKLTQDEIDYIEDNLAPMGDQEEVDLVGEEYSDGLDGFEIEE